MMESLGNHFMQAIGLSNNPASPPSPPQQGQLATYIARSRTTSQLVIPGSGQGLMQPGFSTPGSMVSSGSSTPNLYDDMSPSDIELIYKGVEEMDDGNIRDEQSILILGESGAGKSYLARYLVEGMHSRNEYKHLVLITSYSTYFNTTNSLRSVSRLEQVILWDCLKDKKEKRKCKKLVRIY